jgi:putative colanic acid biosynthesis glycosyltransferase
LYSLADVFVNPTWEDNFPTTNIEALACGTPVITYQTGGSPEALTPETGFVVEQGDLAGIRDAIDSIKSKGKSFYAESCRERAVKMFNKNERYAEYLELYEQMLSEKQ